MSIQPLPVPGFLHSFSGSLSPAFFNPVFPSIINASHYLHSTRQPHCPIILNSLYSVLFSLLSRPVVANHSSHHSFNTSNPANHHPTSHFTHILCPAVNHSSYPLLSTFLHLSSVVVTTTSYPIPLYSFATHPSTIHSLLSTHHLHRLTFKPVIF